MHEWVSSYEEKNLASIWIPKIITSYINTPTEGNFVYVGRLYQLGLEKNTSEFCLHICEKYLMAGGGRDMPWEDIYHPCVLIKKELFFFKKKKPYKSNASRIFQY